METSEIPKGWVGYNYNLGTYQADTLYTLGDVVSFAGTLYHCQVEEVYNISPRESRIVWIART